jgi:hypothetical protein
MPPFILPFIINSVYNTIRNYYVATKDELKKQIIAYINRSSTTVDQLETIVAAMNRPLLESSLKKWGQSKGLPKALIDDLTNKLSNSNDLTQYEKLKFVNDLADGVYYLDFKGMLRSALNKKTKLKDHFTAGNSKVANWILKTYRDNTTASLLGAPTNIGKGEIAMIILGGLKKPSKGDLETDSEMIEVKEGGGAAMIPKKAIHPNKQISAIKAHIRTNHKDLYELLPSTDAGGGENNVAHILSIKTTGSGDVFPLGQLAKVNGIPVSTVRDVMQKFHDLVYAGSLRFDVKKYIKDDYSFDFNSYGRDNFAALFHGYKSEYGFTNLMYFNIGHPPGGTKTYGNETVYCFKNKEDAKAFYKRFGSISFTGGDNFGRAYGYGGTYNEAKYRRAT